MVSARTLHGLVQLALSLHDWPRTSDPKLSLDLLSSPNLQRVSLRNLPFTFYDTMPERNFSPWNNITDLCVNGCSLLEIVTLLKYFPYLIHGYFNISDKFPTMISNHLSENISLRMPYLNSLLRTEEWFFDCSFSRNDLYAFIHAPQLRRFRYKASTESCNIGTSASSLLSLLEGSTGLEMSVLDRLAFSQDIVRRFMHTTSAHSLTKLVLTSGYTFRDRSRNQVDSFNLSCLIVNGNADTITPIMDVLPSLEDFELHDTLESDDTVLKFITSRMDPFSHIAVLKRVKILFVRVNEPNGIDIQEQVELHARKTGISLIELNLEYLPPLPILEYDNPFFPPIKSDCLNTVTDTANSLNADHTWGFWVDE